MSLNSILQVQWPRIKCRKGSIGLRMNRPGTKTYTVAATDTLVLSTNGPKIINDTDLSQKFQTNEGRKAFDAVQIQMFDKRSYSGTVNGASVSEDFSAANKTFFSTFFNVKGTAFLPNPYWMWLDWIDDNGNVDKFFMGTYDALMKPQPYQSSTQTETANENLIGIRNFLCVSGATMLNSTIWQDALSLITPSDAVQGDAYNGFVYLFQTMPLDDGGDVTGRNNTINGLFHTGKLYASPSYGDPTYALTPACLQQAVPFVLVQPDQNGVVCRSVNAPYPSFDGRQNVGIDGTTPWPSTPWLHGVLSDVCCAPTYPAASFGVGTGYVVGDTGTINGGSTPATYIVTAITGGGAVTAIHITFGGTGYTNDTTRATTTGGAQPGVGTGLTVTIALELSRFGPWGTWWIKIGTLIEKMCQAAGFAAFTPSTDLVAALDVYKQKADNTLACFPVDVASGPVSVLDQYVSLNVVAGCHPWDGAPWQNPLAYNPTNPIQPYLQGLCDFLLVDYTVTVDQTTGAPKLTLRSYGATAASRPTNWTPADKPSEDQPGIDTVSVSVNNLADGLQIIAPLLTTSSQSRGSSLSKQVPFRLRQLGETSPLLPPQLMIGEFSSVERCMTWDDSSKLNEQAAKCFMVAAMDRGDDTVIAKNNDCWIGLSGVYFFDAVGTTVQAMYPSIWPAFDNWNPTATSGAYAGTFGVLGAQYPAGATITNASEPNRERFDSRNFQAVVLSNYLVPKPTILKRNYHGVQADDGTLSNVQVGFQESWWYDGALRTFQAIDISRHPKANITNVRYQETSALTFPDITDIPHGPLGTSGGTQTGSSTYYSGSIGSSPTLLPPSNLLNLGDFRIMARSVVFWSGGIVVKTLPMRTFETYDPVAKIWVVQFGIPLPFEPETGSTYGFNTYFRFHPKGTEHANVQIIGVSGEDPDYWADGIVQVKRDTDTTANKNVYYGFENMLWSEDQNNWLFQRPLEKANLARRIYVHGRITAVWDATHSKLSGTWANTSDPHFKMSNAEINIDSDIDGSSAGNPTITGTASSLVLSWGSRQKPVTLSATASYFNGAIVLGKTIQIGAMPPVVQSPGPHDATLQFWTNDFVAGKYNWNQAVSPPMTGGAATDEFLYVDVWGMLEIIGDDARSR